MEHRAQCRSAGRLRSAFQPKIPFANPLHDPASQARTAITWTLELSRPAAALHSSTWGTRSRFTLRAPARAELVAPCGPVGISRRCRDGAASTETSFVAGEGFDPPAEQQLGQVVTVHAK